MNEAADLLSQFFADKAISGDPITPEESEWIQNLLTPSQTEPSQQQGVIFDDSQSVVFQGEPEPNCFLSQSTLGFSQPSAYDSQEVLRKYYHHHSASQDMQPSQLTKKIPLSNPRPLLASLDSQRVLTPILETFKAKSSANHKLAAIKGLDKVEGSVQTDRMDRQAAKEVQPGLTNIASAIIQVLGDPGKDKSVSSIAERKEELKAPAVINIPVFPMTPSPAAVVKPFIVDTFNDSEAFPKRIRTAEPDKPAATPTTSKVNDSSSNSSLEPAAWSQPSQQTHEPVLFPPSQASTVGSEALQPSLPVFEFYSPSSDASQSDNNSLMREARQCSSGELPKFVF